MQQRVVVPDRFDVRTRITETTIGFGIPARSRVHIDQHSFGVEMIAVQRTHADDRPVRPSVARVLNARKNVRLSDSLAPVDNTINNKYAVGRESVSSMSWRHAIIELTSFGSISIQKKFKPLLRDPPTYRLHDGLSNIDGGVQATGESTEEDLCAV
jgi:hypothetical protein